MQKFIDILSVGGKTNSLGRANEVMDAVLADASKLGELYECVSADDAWVRMRAADCLEKICRVHPDWIEQYLEKILTDWTLSTQPSIQWHLAQIVAEVRLSDVQRKQATAWLKKALSSTDVDWIVAVNTMKTLLQFCREGQVTKDEIMPLFELQRQHKSNTVQKKAAQFLQDLS
jgi:hypothetical protein